jgi:hypothetical protein
MRNVEWFILVLKPGRDHTKLKIVSTRKPGRLQNTQPSSGVGVDDCVIQTQIDKNKTLCAFHRTGVLNS